MTKRSFALLVLTCSALGAACGDDTALEPDPPSEPIALSRLEVIPNAAVLHTISPENEVQLAVRAHDQWGRWIPDPGVATYSSSAPAIAEVSSSGLVMAAAPGVSEISATLTLGGVTRTASMEVTVYDPTAMAVNGAFDLTVTVTSGDAWSVDLTGFGVTGVLTLEHDSRYALGIGGTGSDLRLVYPNGDLDERVFSGVITSYFGGSDGREPIIELDAGELFLMLVPLGNLQAPLIEGSTWVMVSDTRGGVGPFSAQRRPDE